MKKLALVALLASFGTLSAQNKDFTIEVSFADAKVGGKYVFSSVDLEDKIADTIAVKKVGEKIVYKKPFSQSGFMSLAYIQPEEKKSGRSLEIFVNSPSTIKISGKEAEHLNLVNISGGAFDSPAVKESVQKNKDLYEVFVKWSQASKVENNKAAVDSIVKVYEAADAKLKDAKINIIKTQTSSIYSAALLSRMLREELSVIEPLYNALSTDVKNSKYGKTVSDKLEVIRAIQVGKPAPDFTLTDIDGSVMRLSDYRGKWVLLDFWGSWCIWCRRGNPALVELYNKYGGKDFEILGLAARDKEDAWKKAIIDDKLPWKHANLDLNEGGNKLPLTYNVPGYPTKILIDPKGDIAVISVGYHEKNDPVELKLIEELGELYVK